MEYKRNFPVVKKTQSIKVLKDFCQTLIDGENIDLHSDLLISVPQAKNKRVKLNEATVPSAPSSVPPPVNGSGWFA